MADRYDVIRYPATRSADAPRPRRRVATLFGIDAVAPRCRARDRLRRRRQPARHGARAARRDFVGFDLSGGRSSWRKRVRTSSASRTCASRRSGSRTFEAPAASFDYVVAHGVFSWVPGPRPRAAARALRARPLRRAASRSSATTRCPATASARRCASCSRSSSRASTSRGERIAGARAPARAAQRRERARDRDRRRGGGARTRAPDALLFHDALAEVNDAFAHHGLRRARRGPRAALPRRGRPARPAHRRPAARRPRRAAGHRRRPAPRARCSTTSSCAAFARRCSCRAGVALDRARPIAARIASLAVASPARALVADDERPEPRDVRGARAARA